MRRKKAMTRTELPVALHVVFQQHSFPVTRILAPGPKHTDGKFVFECTNNASLKKKMHKTLPDFKHGPASGASLVPGECQEVSGVSGEGQEVF